VGRAVGGRPLGAAAVVGGVVGPVPGAGVLPGDGDVDVDPEHSGQEGCGELGGELEERGAAGSARSQAELA